MNSAKTGEGRVGAGDGKGDGVGAGIGKLTGEHPIKYEQAKIQVRIALLQFVGLNA